MLTTQQVPRGRPRAFDIEAAIQAAMHVFWRDGFDAASVAVLTDAMEINAPSFYAAFGSKEGLFCRVLERYHAPFVSMATALMDAPLGTGEAFERLIRRVAKSHCGSGSLGGCLIVTSGVMVFREDSEVGKKLATLVANNRRLFEARLKKGQRMADVPNRFSPREVADYVNGLLHAMASVGRISQSRPAVRAIAKLGIETLRRTLGE
jgi:AcrR family transcriptional regulator